jgi:hypothetical protein
MSGVLESILRDYHSDVRWVGAAHHVPHFHAYYQEDVAVVGIDPIEILAGSLPRRQQRLVEAWGELHQVELMEDWRRLQAGQPPQPIAPPH